MNQIDLTGKTFGRWTVIEQAPRDGLRGTSKWVCKCACGKTKPAVRYNALTTGQSQSCGCLRAEKQQERRKPDFLVHRQRNPVYRMWLTMKARCYNANHPSYSSHGAKGEVVCERWVKSFDAFIADMGQPPLGAVLRLKEGESTYCKANCHWEVK